MLDYHLMSSLERLKFVLNDVMELSYLRSICLFKQTHLYVRIYKVTSIFIYSVKLIEII